MPKVFLIATKIIRLTACKILAEGAKIERLLQIDKGKFYQRFGWVSEVPLVPTPSLLWGPRAMFWKIWHVCNLYMFSFFILWCQFFSAKLSGAKLSSAKLSSAKLSGVKLHSAKLSKVSHCPVLNFSALNCPLYFHDLDNFRFLKFEEINALSPHFLGTEKAVCFSGV